ncbi:AMP-dependent synthetase/ligase [Bacteroidota bacterium]
MKAITTFFEESVQKFSGNIYLWEKKNGEYVGETYKEVKDRVYQFAAGLISIGIKKGDRIALIAEGRNDWVVSEIGILYSGAVNVPLSVKLSEPSEIQFRISHSGSRFVIASKNQIKKIRPIINQLPELEKVIILDGIDKENDKEVWFSEIMEKGKMYLEKNNEEFEKTWKSVQPDDYANICYTSGTTADPKGIILSHGNYTSNVEQAYSLIDVTEDYKTLLILPWDHSFAHTTGIYCFMGKGASMASIEVGNTSLETVKNIPKNIKEIKPTILMSAPALAKNFKKNIEKGIREKGGIAEKLFKHALKISYKYNKLGWNKGKGLTFIYKPLINLYDKILFSKVREAFGGELKFFVGGAALLDIELQKFFYAIGTPMYQGYGLSEASPVISANAAHKHKLGTSGIIGQPMECKICDEDDNELPVGEKGEIVIKGNNVMKGYWKNEKATKDTIKNGWLHTGDLGYLDKDGFLYVLGRFKSLLIADDGEKFSPESIEEAFVNNSPLIDQCVLYNNQNPYTIAFIVPNKEAIKKFANENNINLGEQSGIEKICSSIENELKEYRTGGKYEDMFPQRWLPSSIALLSEGFTEENRLMNSTLKVVRGKVAEKYKDWIDYLYTPESKLIVNKKNIESLKELL